MKWNCQYCGKNFRKSHNLRTHQAQEHPEKYRTEIKTRKNGVRGANTQNLADKWKQNNQNVKTNNE